MSFKLRIKGSSDGQPWLLLSEGVLIPGFQPVLLNMPNAPFVPDHVLRQLDLFPIAQEQGGTFNFQDGTVAYQFEALSVEGFRGVMDWLDRHSIAICRVEAAGDTSIQICVQSPNSAPRFISLSWNFLGEHSPERISAWMEQHRFADQIRENNVYIRDLTDFA